MDSGVPLRRSGRRPHSPVARLGALLLVSALVPGMGHAQDRAVQKPAPPAPAAQKPVPAKPAPAKPASAAPASPDPVFEAVKAGFEARPETERKALQDALVWTGDFNAVVSGAFGRRTFEALESYRARTGSGDPLDPRGRAALLAAGEAARNAARFRIAADPGSGATVGVPERLLSKRTALPSGTRWQSADGRVTLETRAYPPGADTLDALFERATAPLPDRKVTYKLRRPDFLVVTAETGPGLSYIRYAAGPQGVRGFLVGYDRAMAPEVDRLVIAVANAFDPFPAAAPPTAPALASGPPAVQAPASATASGTGLVIAPGRVLTASAALDGCPAPRIGSAPARVIATDPAGLALLEAPGAMATVRVAIRAEPVAADEGLIALAAGPDGVSAAPAVGIAGGVIAPLQPGSAGAPVVDRAGRLAGLVTRYPAAPRLVAGIVPPARLPLVAGATIAAFLAGQGVAAAPPRDSSPGAVVPAVVGLGCR